MRHVKELLVVIILLSLAGCKENDDENIICTNQQLPGEYFPAFPKSWWNYYNYDNEPVKWEISEDYEECEGKCRPVFLNLDKCIQGASLIQRFYAGLGTSATIESPIYSTIKDSILVCPISFSTFKQQDSFLNQDDVIYRRKTTVIDTNISVNGVNYTNVRIVYEYNKIDSLHRYYDYFAKNIGLIKRDSVNVNDSTELIEILRIDSYYIGN